MIPPISLAMVLLVSATGGLAAAAGSSFERKSRSDPDFVSDVEQPNHVGEIGDRITVSYELLLNLVTLVK